MILFYSDYLEGAHPAILERLQETNFTQTPGYGEDIYCENAKALIKRLCGRPDAEVHFLVGGTQTNVTVISSILRPWQGVLCAETGHIGVHETGAVEHTGHKVLTLPSYDGKVKAEDVDAALKAHYEDPSTEHMVQPGMLYISFPTELGTIYTKKELEGLKSVCSEWNIPLFIDGARLGYGLAAADCDLTLEDLAGMADVFYMGGTKQGALFGEAVVFGDSSLSGEFRYSIKQNGGMLAKGRLLGLQFGALLEDGLYFDLARKADDLADRIRNAFEAMGFGMLVRNRTNQVFPILTPEAMDILSRNFGFEEWKRLPDGLTAVRFCTSWATGDEQVDALVNAVEVLPASSVPAH